MRVIATCQIFCPGPVIMEQLGSVIGSVNLGNVGRQTPCQYSLMLSKDLINLTKLPLCSEAFIFCRLIVADHCFHFY